MRDDETELDIEFGDGAPQVDDGAPQVDDGAPPPERPRWHPALPWVGVSVALGVVGMALASAMLPDPRGSTGLVDAMAAEPVLRWEAETCGADAYPALMDGVLVVVGSTCVQGFDLATGEELWLVDDRTFGSCQYAYGPRLACLALLEAEPHVVMVDIASGVVTERAADGVGGVIAYGDDLVESEPHGDTITVRRVAPDGTERWSRTLDRDPQPEAVNIGQLHAIGPVVVAWGATDTPFLDVADGEIVEVTWSDARGGLVGVVASDGERTVRAVDGRTMATLEADQVLAAYTDDLGTDHIVTGGPGGTSSATGYSPATGYVVRDADGRELWELPAGMHPMVKVSDVLIVAPASTSPASRITARDLRTGDELWTASIDEFGLWRTWTDGVRLVTGQYDQGEWLAAYDARSGTEVWRVQVAEPGAFGVMEIGPDGSVVVGTMDGIAVWRSP